MRKQIKITTTKNNKEISHLEMDESTRTLGFMSLLLWVGSLNFKKLHLKIVNAIEKLASTSLTY